MVRAGFRDLILEKRLMGVSVESPFVDEVVPLLGLSMSRTADLERDRARVFRGSPALGSRELESPEGGMSRSLVY